MCHYKSHSLKLRPIQHYCFDAPSFVIVSSTIIIGYYCSLLLDKDLLKHVDIAHDHQVAQKKTLKASDASYLLCL